MAIAAPHRELNPEVGSLSVRPAITKLAITAALTTEAGAPVSATYPQVAANVATIAHRRAPPRRRGKNTSERKVAITARCVPLMASIWASPASANRPRVSASIYDASPRSMPSSISAVPLFTPDPLMTREILSRARSAAPCLARPSASISKRSASQIAPMLFLKQYGAIENSYGTSGGANGERQRPLRRILSPGWNSASPDLI